MLTAFLAGHAAGRRALGRRDGDARPERIWRRLGSAQMLARPTALLIPAPPGGDSRPDQSRVVRGGDDLLGGAHPVPSGDQPGRLRALGRVPGGKLRAGRSSLRRPSGGRWERAPAGSTDLNTLGAIVGAIVDHGLADPRPGRPSERSCCWPSSRRRSGPWRSFAWGAAGRAGRGGLAAAALGAIAIACACALNLASPFNDIYARQEPGKLLRPGGVGSRHHRAPAHSRPTG